MILPPGKDNPELLALLDKARAAFDAMTPEEKAEMVRQQRRSWVLAEAAMGSDADEVAYNAAVLAGDQKTVDRLVAEASERERIARKWLDENGY